MSSEDSGLSPSPTRTKDAIYTIHILNAKSEIVNTLVFDGENSLDSNTIHSKMYIHKDDSITTIKRKILFELLYGKYASSHSFRPAYEELYLFSYTKYTKDQVNLFFQTAFDKPVAITDAEVALDAFSIKSDLPAKDEITYDDIFPLIDKLAEPIFCKTSIGQSFTGQRDPFFEICPFKVDSLKTREPANYFLFENRLLLNHGTLKDNTIYLCLAQDAFDTAMAEYVSRYYYPLLFKEDIYSKPDLFEKHGKLLRATKSVLGEDLKSIYKSVDLYYDLHYKMGIAENLKYGIRSITFKIENTKNRNVSLEMAFKALHSTIEMPFIKYNPGNRRENLYRLYYENLAKNGKKIPLLSKTLIWKLSKEIGKSEQIGIYIYNKQQPFYIYIDKHGDLYVSAEFNQLQDETQLNQFFSRELNPLVLKINQWLEQTSIVLPQFSLLRSPLVSVVDLVYSALSPIYRKIHLEQIPCIYSFFTFNREKDNNIIRYKRVENYSNMDAVTAYITEMLQSSAYSKEQNVDIFSELMSRFGLNEDSAKIAFANVYSKFIQFGSESIERPGFPVQLKVDVNTNTFELSVEGITSILYIDSLFVYLNSIVHITQYLKPGDAAMKKLKAITDKTKKVEEQPVAENVVVIAKEPVNIVQTETDIDELFRQFGIFDDEEDEEEEDQIEEIKEQKVEDLDENIDVDKLLEELNENIDTGLETIEEKTAPILYDESEQDVSEEETKIAEQETKIAEPEVIKKPILYEDSEESEEKTIVVKPVADKDSDKDSDTESDEKEIKIRETEEVEPMVEEKFQPPQEIKKVEDTNMSRIIRGPIIYDDEEDEESMEGGNADDDEKYKYKPDGRPLKSVLLKRLQKYDPALFIDKPVGEFGSYSTSCQPVRRHPVVLSKEEFEKTDPEAYDQHIKYGTDKENPNYYICPKYWCFLTNSAISEKDALAGKCGKIIPKGEKTIPPGAYVMQTSDVEQYPGFIESAHPDGHCLPCCFKSWSGKLQVEARGRCMPPDEDRPKKRGPKPTKKTQQYVIGIETYPVTDQRWGFLPIPVQLFMNIDYSRVIDKNIAGVVIPNAPTLLRYGVEQSSKQSLIGSFADIYAYVNQITPTPSVDEFKKILVEKLSLDIFVKLQNGSLASAFRPIYDHAEGTALIRKYKTQIESSVFASGMQSKDKKMMLTNIIAAYDNYKRFLLSKDAEINHVYLWDLLSLGFIIKGGLNLIIMEMNESDMRGQIDIICPSSSYSRARFDSKKPSFFILKQGEFYEPIYLCEFLKNESEPFRSTKLFHIDKVPETIRDLIRNIEMVSNKYCNALPSMPKVYKFRAPIDVTRLLSILKAKGFTPLSQIINYNGKTIGIYSEIQQQKVYIPCAPGRLVDDLPINYMDDLELIQDYEATKSALIHLHKSSNEVPCYPVMKVKDDKNLIIGFITESNQFVPIHPNQNIEMDTIRVYPSVHQVMADKVVQLFSETDKERVLKTKKIKLESEFYYVFRKTIRELLNRHSNRQIKSDIMKIVESLALLDQQKRVKVEALIRRLIDTHIIFVDIDDDVLLDLDNLNTCGDNPMCLIKENGEPQLSIPKKHLIADSLDNERIYLGRIADELVRNERVKIYMFDTKKYLNVKNVNYTIHSDEFIIAQTALTADYFSDLDALKTTEHITNIDYYSAQPSISATYSNEPISLTEQYKKSDTNETIEKECVVKEVDIIGNVQSFWKKLFPKRAKEIVFRDTEECTFLPMCHLLSEKYGKIVKPDEVRQYLWSAYTSLINIDPSFEMKIWKILKAQGKSKMMDQVIKKQVSFETLVFSNQYYLSDMDLWVLCASQNLPVILFNTNGLKGFVKKDLEWLKLGGEINDTYYFIRSNAGSFANKVYEYHLIHPQMKLSSLGELNSMVREGYIAGSKYQPNVQTAEEYLKKVVFIGK